MTIEEMSREQLIDLAKKLPVTADGVPIWPGMVVYDSNSADGEKVHAVSERKVIFMKFDDGARLYAFPDGLYSTRELAVAAREKEESVEKEL